MTNLLLICALALLLVFTVVLLFIQFRRADKATSMAIQLVWRLQEIADYVEEASAVLDQTPQIKVAFEADDEVGAFFTQLENIKNVLRSLAIDEQDKEAGSELQ